MTVMERLANSIVVPVVVLDKVEDAIPTAKAMAAGGVDTMEITFRTACAPDAIRAVAENCPDVLVGAGTIVNVEQAKLAVEMGAKFIVSISNEGETIPPEELPLVFDRFHKLDKSRSQNRDGWGLGLYIVKTIVCSHGENISVTSKDGKTEFTFTMPLVN